MLMRLIVVDVSVVCAICGTLINEHFYCVIVIFHVFSVISQLLLKGKLLIPQPIIFNTVTKILTVARNVSTPSPKGQPG